MIASDSSGERLAFRPVYVAAMEPTTSPMTDEPVWTIPAASDVTPGTFLFTVDRLLAGLVVDDGARLVLIPGSTLTVLADRIVEASALPPADLGIQVQHLAGRVADAVGVDRGVVVTWVDPSAGSAASLVPGDVIESVDGIDVPDPGYWAARLARIRPGAAVALRVRRSGEVHDVPIVAREVLPAVDRPSTLGVAMRARRRAGTELVRVDTGSAADAAGLRAGDLITRIGGIPHPAPSEVRRVFAEAAAGTPILLAATRGTTYLVTTLEK